MERLSFDIACKAVWNHTSALSERRSRRHGQRDLHGLYPRSLSLVPDLSHELHGVATVDLWANLSLSSTAEE